MKAHALRRKLCHHVSAKGRVLPGLFVALSEPDLAHPVTMTTRFRTGWWETEMVYYALVFLVIALIAGVLGFGGLAGASAGIAQILFFLFLAFLVISLVVGFIRRA